MRHDVSRRVFMAAGIAAAGASALAGVRRGAAAAKRKPARRKKAKAPKPPLVSAIVLLDHVTARDSGSIFLARMDVLLLDLRQDPATPRESRGKTASVPGGSVAAMEAAIRTFVHRIAVDDWGMDVPADRVAVLIA